MRRPLTTAALLALLAGPAMATSHVRVVLDLSQSMRTNDPGKSALLATVLLHDLARPNSTLGDSFEVIPFAPNWSWRNPGDPPPAGNGPRLRSVLGQRDSFKRQVTGLPYNAAMTYFYPGLLEAVRDLEQKPTGTTDIRTIVLVTDGLPEAPTRDRELELIQQDIVPKLEQGNIRLYILAFGPVADKNRDFFGRITRTDQGLPLGEYFVDPRGEELLTYMMQIFSRSFGYSVGPSQKLPGVSALDLEGSITPEKVAVVVLSDRPQPEPRLSLTAPAGGAVNAPEGVQSASAGAQGVSYSLEWVWSPGVGAYSFDTDALRGTVAVLRPTRLVLEIVAVKPRTRTGQAMARTRFPLTVRVKSPTGAQAPPGPVDLSFRTLGERFRNPETGKTDYRWKSDRGAPPAGPGKPTPAGREYEIMVEFPEHPERPDQIYIGFLEVEARQGEAVVGSLVTEKAHRVEVHPFLEILPSPLGSFANGPAGQGLRRRDEGCSQISFEVTEGSKLPHPDKPQYTVRTVLAPADPAMLDRELRKATFTLDGFPLDLESRPAVQPSPWTGGRTLDQAEFIGKKHTLCVRVGKPVVGNPAAQLQLVSTLQEDPYDELGVIKPHTLKVSIAPPTFIEKWNWLLLSLLALLLLLALFWYTRGRPEIPRDLGYAVGREDAPSLALRPQPLEERSLWARLLGLGSERPVVAPAEDRLLGRVRPVGAELFQLRPARGVHVEPFGREESIPFHRGLATLAVHRLYRLRTDRGAYLFRMEYQ